MNVLIVNKSFIQRGINVMGLIWVHCPSILELILFVLHLLPCILLHHELSRHLVPSLLPVNSCVNDQDHHIIDSCVHSDQAEPAVFHCSELVVINYQTVIVQLILVHWALEVELNGVLWTKFMDGDYALFGLLYLDLTWNVAFKGSDEKAVWTLLNLSDFNIFGSCEVFPLFCMFNIKLFRHVADWCWVGLLFWIAVVVFTILEVNVFEGLLCVEL